MIMISKILTASILVLAVSCESLPEPVPGQGSSWAPRAAELGLSSVLRVMSDGGNSGSGFFIHPAGLAVTNAHVVSGTGGGVVQFANGDAPGGMARYEVLALGDSRDLALLQVQVERPVPSLALGLSEPLALGTPLLAVGAPQGMFPVVTTGVLSGRSRPGAIGPLFVPEQLIHSAPTLRGSSGCPILSAAGAVIGVQSAKPGAEAVKVSDAIGEQAVSFDENLARWSFQTEAFGLAIPVEDLRSFAGGWVAPEWTTGLESGFVCDASRAGCHVLLVVPGSPAEIAGLKIGDNLIGCNGLAVHSVVDLSVRMLSEERLSLDISRNGNRLALSFERKPWGPPPVDQLSAGLLWREIGGIRSKVESYFPPDVARSGVLSGPRLSSDHAGSDAFALEYRAWLDFPESGRWILELSSDDGSQLYVRDKLVVDCDGLHSSMAVRGELDLDAGLQPVRLLFFEARGEEALRLRWALEGEDLAVIPDDAFFHAPGSGW